MNKIRLTAISTILLTAMSLTANAGYIETFDNNNANWNFTTINNGGRVAYGSPVYHSSGGNDGGYISASVNSGRNRLYDFEPSNVSVFGDLTGLTLTVDTKIDGSITGPGNHPVARFYVGSSSGGSNYFVSNDAFSWDLNNDTSWTTHQVVLDRSNFLEWPNRAAHSKSFDEILANPQDIGVFFTDSSDHFRCNNYLGLNGSCSAVVNLDNFGTVESAAVPEPAMFLLLGLGSLMVIPRKRMYKQ